MTVSGAFTIARDYCLRKPRIACEGVVVNNAKMMKMVDGSGGIPNNDEASGR